MFNGDFCVKWLRILLVIGVCSGVTACSATINRIDQIRLQQPISWFMNSPYFDKQFLTAYLDQWVFETKFTGERAPKYLVSCIQGASQIITVLPPKKLVFTREGALGIIKQVLPKPGLRMVECDSEDLEKRDTNRICE